MCLRSQGAKCDVLINTLCDTAPPCVNGLVTDTPALQSFVCSMWVDQRDTTSLDSFAFL